MSLRTTALVAGLIPLSIFLGFVTGMGLIEILNAVLPPFQPSDDDTMREFVPAALAYLIWGATTLVTLILAWRRLRRGR
jgi:MFS superfamily sulfate permease-like transporter